MKSERGRPESPELAWFYDDPEAPKQVLLCGETCDTLAANKEIEIDVVVGCATIVR